MRRTDNASANLPPPPRKREQGRLTHERLLAAAIELMAEGGEAAVTLVATAERAGVTRGTAHHHFRTRDALIKEMRTSLETQLLHLSDGSKLFKHPFGLIPKLAVEDESIVRSRMFRLLDQGISTDARTLSLLERYRLMSAGGLLRGDVDPDCLAFITSALDLGGLMAISTGRDAQQRRAAAQRFGEAVYQLFRYGVFNVAFDAEFAPAEPPRKKRGRARAKKTSEPQ